MVKLTKNVDYGFMILGYLAVNNNQKTSAKEIAEKQGLSKTLVAKILKKLSNDGIVTSKQGIYGGYYLSKDADKITLSEIINIVEGKIGLTECMRTNDNPNSDNKLCSNIRNCIIKKRLTVINDEINKFLDNITLAYLVNIDEDKEIKLLAKHK